MDDATQTRRSAHYDVYGVRASFSSTEPAHYAQLDTDYDVFACPAGAEPDVELHVERGPLAAPSAETIVGGLGDHVDVDGSKIRIRGPRVADPVAYVNELRGYFTASILRRLVARDCVQQVHASVVGTPRGAVMFAGAKKSGKTSLALLSVATGRSYKSNDISFLRLSDEKGVEGFGLPQAFTVGLGAQDWFARNLPEIGLDTRQNGLEASDLYLLEVGEKAHIHRHDIARFATVDPQPQRLAAVVFPEPNMHADDARIQRLSVDEAGMRLAMLAEHHLRWGLPPELALDGYLHQLGRVIAAATSQVPFFHLQWCPDHDKNLRVLEREVFRS